MYSNIHFKYAQTSVVYSVVITLLSLSAWGKDAWLQPQQSAKPFFTSPTTNFSSESFSAWPEAENGMAYRKNEPVLSTEYLPSAYSHSQTRTHSLRLRAKESRFSLFQPDGYEMSEREKILFWFWLIFFDHRGNTQDLFRQFKALSQQQIDRLIQISSLYFEGLLDKHLYGPALPAGGGDSTKEYLQSRGMDPFAVLRKIHRLKTEAIKVDYVIDLLKKEHPVGLDLAFERIGTREVKETVENIISALEGVQHPTETRGSVHQVVVSPNGQRVVAQWLWGQIKNQIPGKHKIKPDLPEVPSDPVVGEKKGRGRAVINIRNLPETGRPGRAQFAGVHSYYPVFSTERMGESYGSDHMVEALDRNNLFKIIIPVDVPADNDCFFHAVAMQLPNLDYKGTYGSQARVIMYRLKEQLYQKGIKLTDLLDMDSSLKKGVEESFGRVFFPSSYANRTIRTELWAGEPHLIVTSILLRFYPLVISLKKYNARDGLAKLNISVQLHIPLPNKGSVTSYTLSATSFLIEKIDKNNRTLNLDAIIKWVEMQMVEQHFSDKHDDLEKQLEILNELRKNSALKSFLDNRPVVILIHDIEDNHWKGGRILREELSLNTIYSQVSAELRVSPEKSLQQIAEQFKTNLPQAPKASGESTSSSSSVVTHECKYIPLSEEWPALPTVRELGVQKHVVKPAQWPDILQSQLSQVSEAVIYSGDERAEKEVILLNEIPLGSTGPGYSDLVSELSQMTMTPRSQLSLPPGQEKVKRVETTPWPDLLLSQLEILSQQVKSQTGSEADQESISNGLCLPRAMKQPEISRMGASKGNGRGRGRGRGTNLIVSIPEQVNPGMYSSYPVMNLANSELQGVKLVHSSPELLDDYHVPYALFNMLNLWGINRGDIYLVYLEFYKGITFRPEPSDTKLFPVFSIPVQFEAMYQWLHNTFLNADNPENFNNDQGWTLFNKDISVASVNHEEFKAAFENVCQKLVPAIKLGSFRGLYFYGLLKILLFQETGEHLHIQQAYGWFNNFIAFFASCLQIPPAETDLMRQNFDESVGAVGLNRHLKSSCDETFNCSFNDENNQDSKYESLSLTQETIIPDLPDDDTLLSGLTCASDDDSMTPSLEDPVDSLALRGVGSYKKEHVSTLVSTKKTDRYSASQPAGTTPSPARPDTVRYVFVDVPDMEDDLDWKLYTAENSPVEENAWFDLIDRDEPPPLFKIQSARNKSKKLKEDDFDKLSNKTPQDVVTFIENKIYTQIPDDSTRDYYLHHINKRDFPRDLIPRKSHIIRILETLSEMDVKKPVRFFLNALEYLMKMNGYEMALRLIRYQSHYLIKKEMNHKDLFHLMKVCYTILEKTDKDKVEQDREWLNETINKIPKAIYMEELDVDPVLQHFYKNSFGMVSGFYLNVLVLKLIEERGQHFNVGNCYDRALTLLDSVLKARFLSKEKMTLISLRNYLGYLIYHFNRNDESRKKQISDIIDYVQPQIKKASGDSGWLVAIKLKFYEKQEITGANKVFVATNDLINNKKYKQALDVIEKNLKVLKSVINDNNWKKLHLYRLRLCAKLYEMTCSAPYYYKGEESLSTIEAYGRQYSDSNFLLWPHIINALLQFGEYDVGNRYATKLIRNEQHQEPNNIALALRMVGLCHIKRRPDITVYIYQLLVGKDFLQNKITQPENCTVCKDLVQSLMAKQFWDIENGLISPSKQRSERIAMMKASAVRELFLQLIRWGHFEKAVWLGEYLVSSEYVDELVSGASDEKIKASGFYNALKMNMVLASFSMGKTEKYSKLLRQITSIHTPFFAIMTELSYNPSSLLPLLKSQHDNSDSHYMLLVMGFYKFLFFINQPDINWADTSALLEELVRNAKILLDSSEQSIKIYPIAARLVLVYQDYKDKFTLTEGTRKILADSDPWELMERGGRYDPELPDALFH